MEEDDPCHGADDEGRNHIRGALEELYAAASRQSCQETCDDGDDACMAAEGVNHGVDGDGAVGNGHQYGSGEDDDAPVEALGAQGFEGRGEAKHLQQQHDARRIDYGHIVSEITKQQDSDEGDIFYVQCKSSLSWLAKIF